MSVLTKQQTMQTLLCHAIAANRTQRRTLTLVVPDALELRSPFYVAVADHWTSLRKQLSMSDEASLAIDLCFTRGRVAWVQKTLDQVCLWRSRRLIRRTEDYRVLTIRQSLLIGQPSENGDQIVLGIANESAELPSWSTPVPIAA